MDNWPSLVIGIDFETHLISNEQPWPKPVCLSTYEIGSDAKLVAGLDDIETELSKILRSTNKTILAHNAVFELGVIYTHFPSLRVLLKQSLEDGRWFCTQIYQQLLNNIIKKQAMDLTLAGLVDLYFNKDISAGKKDPDAWRLRYAELENVPLQEWPEAASQYAIDDSIWAVKVFQEQSQIEKIKYHDQIIDSFYLNITGKKGLHIDLDRVAQLESECWDKIMPSYRELNKEGLIVLKRKYKTTGEPYSSPVDLYDFKKTEHHVIIEEQDKILADWKNNQTFYAVGKRLKQIQLYISGNFQSKIKTVKGVISTSDEALSTYLGEKDDKAIKSLSVITDYEKTLTAFVSRLKEAKPVIRTDYNPIVSSGRTSARASSLYPSVNIQQMPRGLEGVTWDVRNCFVPRPGYMFVSIDYNGLELTSTAHQLYNFYQRSKMRNAINSGEKPTDMHSKFACKIKSLKDRKTCTYEEFVSRKKEPEFKAYRTLAKPLNLGFPGGIGYDTMRTLLAKEGIFPKFKILHIGTSESAVEDLVKKYRKQYPVRIKRIGKFEYAMVYDELVELKGELLALYPELKDFLQNGHEHFLTGETKAVFDKQFNEWESEDMYAFNVQGVRRNWCTYTALCNGYLMQTPSAIGAKRAFTGVCKKYEHDNRFIPGGFIHDEIIGEVLICDEMYDIVQDVADIMITQMQTVLTSVRVAVEADIMKYWSKAGGEWTKTFWKDYNSNVLKSD